MMRALWSHVDIAVPLLALLGFHLLDSLLRYFFQSISYSDQSLLETTSHFFVAEIASCVTSCIVILSYLLSKIWAQNDSSFLVMVNTLTINVLGVLYCVTELLNRGVYRDIFGNLILVSRWSAFFVTIPLVLWTAYSSKNFQPRVCDKQVSLLLIAITLGICSLKQLLQQPDHKYIVIFIGLLVCGCIVFMIWRIFSKNSEAREPRNRETSFDFEGTKENSDLSSAQTNSLIFNTVATMSAFIAIYILLAMDAIGLDVAIALNVVTDAIFRLLLTISTLDIHFTLFHDIEAELRSEQKSHTRRRAFLKYIFHELRIPLNSLTMAIDVLRGNLADSSKLTDDLLNTMECSSSFMEHALNSYITVQQIEEKTFKLHENVINLKDLLDKAVGKLKKNLKEKYDINVVINIQSEFPSQIIGDEKQLYYILNNIVMHAARRTKDFIKIEVIGGYCGDGGRNKYELSVCVVGNGEKITDIEKELFFSPYGLLFRGKIEKSEVEGLSLLISKEIIKLAGGLMTVYSKDDGTAYSFQIPFKIPQMSEERLELSESGEVEEAVEHKDISVPEGGKMASPLNSLHLRNGTLYYQPRSETSSCDSFTFDLNKMVDEGSNEPQPVVRGRASREPSLSSFNCNRDEDDEYGFFDTDVLEAADEETVPMSPHVLPDKQQSQQQPEAYNQKESRLDRQLKKLDESEKSSHLKVLVVDDTPCNVKMLRWLLAINSVKSTPAENGYEAILAFERAKPRFDLIFMDNTMPILSGLNAVKYIRERGFDGAIVAVTGNAMPEEVEKFLSEGADLVVTKPMKMVKLKQILDCFPEDVHSGLAEVDTKSTRKKIQELSLDV